MRRLVFIIMAVIAISPADSQNDDTGIIGTYFLLSGELAKNTQNGNYTFSPRAIYLDNWLKISEFGDGLLAISFMDLPEAYILFNYKDSVYYFYSRQNEQEKRYIWIDGDYIYMSVFPNFYDNGIYDKNAITRLKNNSYLKIKGQAGHYDIYTE